MNSGALRHRITLQRATEARNDHGEITRTWSAIKTVWSEVAPLRGAELVEARQVTAKASHRVRIRADDALALTTQDRILFGARVINIGAIVDTMERGRELVITGTEPL